MPLLTTKVELVELECGNCGVVHAIPKIMHDKCYEEGGYWTCPNGHSRGFKQGRHQRDEIYRERDRLKQMLAQKDDEIKHAQRQWETAEKALKRERKRINAGVCPCCNRTFQNLKRHMETKHKGENVIAIKK